MKLNEKSGLNILLTDRVRCATAAGCFTSDHVEGQQLSSYRKHKSVIRPSELLANRNVIVEIKDKKGNIIELKKVSFKLIERTNINEQTAPNRKWYFPSLLLLFSFILLPSHSPPQESPKTGRRFKIPHGDSPSFAWKNIFYMIQRNFVFKKAKINHYYYYYYYILRLHCK